MKVKLIEGLAGENFVFRARQVLECSEEAGRRLIEHGAAEEASDSAEAEGTLPDSEPFRKRGKDATIIPPRRAVETATTPGGEKAIAPGTPDAGEPEFCTGTTAKGNPCRRKPLPGTSRCAEHPLEE